MRGNRKIADTELRRSFLERVPENARIRALAEKLLTPQGSVSLGL